MGLGILELVLVVVAGAFTLAPLVLAILALVTVSRLRGDVARLEARIAQLEAR